MKCERVIDHARENQYLAMRAIGLLLAIRETTEIPQTIGEQIDQLILELRP